MRPTRAIIMGAGGRDFHNFNVRFRDDPAYRVVAFTAAQIPFIEKRRYPPSLAGRLYPKGIPIFPEGRLVELIRALRAGLAVFAYSDVSHEQVMHKASEALAAGADFMLLGPGSTMLRSRLPVISVCAVRTGCGKSPVVRRLLGILRELGRRPVAIRHPMAYCDLDKQRVQRFSNLDELDSQVCTVEEREEYEPIIKRGFTVWAGVDYSAVLREAEKGADVIVWDGGNNDLPFVRPGLEIVVADALRPGHALTYHPGEANFRRADVLVINKAGTGARAGVLEVKRALREVNPDAEVITADSPVRISPSTPGAPGTPRGMKVVVVEDGPTVTHGGMAYGAGYVAARKAGAEIISPIPYAAGSIRDTLKKFPHIREVLPAMGYSPGQLDDLAKTINAAPCDALVFATPVDLMRLIKLNKPAYRVTYDIKEKGVKTLKTVLGSFLDTLTPHPLSRRARGL